METLFGHAPITEVEQAVTSLLSGLARDFPVLEAKAAVTHGRS
ncbi:hypothetical protein [Amycolatopsis sp. cmx-11-12]